MSIKMNWTGMLLIGLAVMLIAAMVVIGPAYGGKPSKEPPPPPPPNSWIAYIGTNYNDIYLSDGIESGLLLATEVWCGPPSWSPDGSEITLCMADGSGGNGIYGVVTDGSGGPRFIFPFILPWYTHYTAEWSPSPTPTGTEMILFSDYPIGEDPPGAEHSDVYGVHPDGTGLVRLTFEEGPVDVHFPVWSPCATAFVAQRFDAAQNLCELRIYEVGLVAGELAVINETPIAGMAGTPLEGMFFFNLDWSHDGNWIVVCADAEIIRINVNNPFDVFLLTPVDGGGKYVRFSPDDSTIIFSKKVKEGKIKGYKLHSMSSLDGSSLTRLLETDHMEYRPGIRPF